MDSAAVTGAFTLGGVLLGGLINWGVLAAQHRASARAEKRQASRLVALAASRITLAASLGAEDRDGVSATAFKSLVDEPAMELNRFADVLAKLVDDETWNRFQRLEPVSQSA